MISRESYIFRRNTGLKERNSVFSGPVQGQALCFGFNIFLQLNKTALEVNALRRQVRNLGQMSKAECVTPTPAGGGTWSHTVMVFRTRCYLRSCQLPVTAT